MRDFSESRNRELIEYLRPKDFDFWVVARECGITKDDPILVDLGIIDMLEVIAEYDRQVLATYEHARAQLEQVLYEVSLAEDRAQKILRMYKERLILYRQYLDKMTVIIGGDSDLISPIHMQIALTSAKRELDENTIKLAEGIMNRKKTTWEELSPSDIHLLKEYIALFINKDTTQSDIFAMNKVLLAKLVTAYELCDSASAGRLTYLLGRNGRDSALKETVLYLKLMLFTGKVSYSIQLMTGEQMTELLQTVKQGYLAWQLAEAEREKREAEARNMAIVDQYIEDNGIQILYYSDREPHVAFLNSILKGAISEYLRH